jgi:uncharacterized membrane protein (UPF0127 family)
MGRPVDSQSALGLPGCNWVHTFLVCCPLDIAYCDYDGVIVRLVAHVPPNRLAPFAAGAYWAWEMRAGGLAPFAGAGDRLIWEATAAPSRG